MMNPQQHIGRLEDLVRAQMAEIDRLRAENKRVGDEVTNLIEWIRSDRDALTTLQSVYNDPRTSDATRVKAAASALPFERPKLSVSVQVGPGVLGERLDHAKNGGMKTVNPPLIEHQPTS